MDFRFKKTANDRRRHVGLQYLLIRRRHEEVLYARFVQTSNTPHKYTPQITRQSHDTAPGHSIFKDPRGEISPVPTRRL